MMVNTYDITLTKQDGEEITVSLRLGVGSQIKLKKKWKESTTQTLFSAGDDVERFVDIMDAALNWNGNQNPIKSGEELVDLMAENGMLGMTAKQEIVTSLGVASGLFSEQEKEMIDERTSHMFDRVFKDKDGDDTEAKN